VTVENETESVEFEILSCRKFGLAAFDLLARDSLGKMLKLVLLLAVLCVEICYLIHLCGDYHLDKLEVHDIAKLFVGKLNFHFFTLFISVFFAGSFENFVTH
jgi:hypothetical protein